jgi:LysR family hydrogen peroxide-inducible transcriptional activator
VLEAFHREAPRVQLEVVEDVTQVVLRRLQDGEVDVALVALPITSPTLHVEPLFTEELQLALPLRHPLASKSRVTIKDLIDEPFLLLNDSHCLTQNTLSYCERRQFQPLVTSRISQLTTLQELVALGQGVSLIPRMAAKIDTNPTRVYRSLSGEKPTRTIALAWHKQRFQSRIFRRFTVWLQQRAAQD